MKLNGEDFDGRWLNIKYSTPKGIDAPRQASEKPEGCTTIFCGNLSFQVDEESLRAAFAECGEISEVRFATDRETGEFKGFGHIEFVNTESTDKALELVGTDIMGRAVRVDYAADKRQSGGFGGGGRGGGGRGRG
jgi:nucleolin